MCAMCEHLHVFLVVFVDLRTLKNLQTYCAIVVIYQEWTATRLAHVFHNAAYSHWAV